MSPAVFDLSVLYQERIKQLEHKLRVKEEEITVLKTENAILHLRLAETPSGKSCNENLQIPQLYNYEKTQRMRMHYGVIKVNRIIQRIKQSIHELRSYVADQTETLQCQTKHYFKLFLNHVLVMQGESQIMQDLQTRFTCLQKSFEDVNEKYKTEKQTRKILHNTLIELKGNIRVYCRIRPLLPFDKRGIGIPSERQENLSEVVFATNDETILLKSSRPGHLSIDKSFNFERVFHPSESQNSVFEDVRPLITSVLDGYNVCIMAYGQTGSGKTYTMMGPHSEKENCILKENNQELGIIPRASKEIFRLILERSHESHVVEVSITEVYNNDIFDLLAQDSSGVLGIKRDVITNKDGKSEVPYLTHEYVKNDADVLDLVRKGLQMRIKQSTLIHDHSSRSHLVITLTVTAHSFQGQAMADSGRTQKPTKTKLQLVDLAGSECVGMSGVKGAALRETSFINRSLSALSDVLGALSEHCSHIPYRNSRLTHLLQDSIGGDAKLLIMLCVSPCQKFTAESLQTLGFGTRARQVSRPLTKKRIQALCKAK